LLFLTRSLSAVAARLEGKDAAATLLQAVDAIKAWHPLGRDLSALLSTNPVAEMPSRAARAASAGGFPAGSGHPFTAVALLIPAAKPPPCSLTPQQLVDLLKIPPCTGDFRRAVLDHLGYRYRRSFGDAWEFVRCARDQNLDLDFTSPPQRPGEPAAEG
jgi:hypothetical protein